MKPSATTLTCPCGVTFQTLVREHAEVADVEVAPVVREGRRNDVALARREVDDAAEVTAGPDPVDLPVVRLDGVERTVDSDHVEPGAVGLEVERLRMRDWVRSLEGTEVRDHRPAAVLVDADDPVGNPVVSEARPKWQQPPLFRCTLP